MRIPVFFAALVATVLLSTGSALAAPPVILTVGQISQHPTATWSFPAGVQSQVVEVATNPATGSDGYFFFENVKAFDVPQPTDTSWTYTFQLDPGTYYVHVGGFDSTCGACPVREFSSILTLIIPAPPPPPPLPPPPPPTPPIITSATGDGSGLIAVAWTLPTGVTSTEVQISSDPAVDSLGFFSVASQVDFSVLSAAQTTYTTTRAQAPGTYYVHVAGNQPSLNSLFVWSSATPVIIPARTPTATTVKAPTAAKKTVTKGNASSVVRSSTKAYAASANALVRSINGCVSLSCVGRRVTAFARQQLSYDRSVKKDITQPGECGAAARGLRARLRRSETSTTALHRAILRGQRGANLKAFARTAGFQAGKAIASSRLYVAACG
jgi:hypothetical protein